MAQQISRDDIVHVANLARLALADDEIAKMTDELSAVLDHARDVEALELNDVEPTTNPMALTNIWREDVVGATLDREEVLEVAPAAEEDRFKVPAILGDAP